MAAEVEFEGEQTPATGIKEEGVLGEGVVPPLPHPSVFTQLLRNRRNDLILNRTAEVIPEWCVLILRALVLEQVRLFTLALAVRIKTDSNNNY